METDRRAAVCGVDRKRVVWWVALRKTTRANQLLTDWPFSSRGGTRTRDPGIMRAALA